MAYSLPQVEQSFLDVDPTRSAALERLHKFVPLATDYGAKRNYALPEREGVSVLSPYLRYRLITERETVQAVLEKHPYEAVSKFIEEVCWRTYWKGYLEMRPALWTRYLHDLQLVQNAISEDAALETALEAAYSGQTGINCFDAWVQELVETGWLHNHVRMWFASIWIFTLRLPWQAGAAFFYKHLLDGDPASNTLSWRWVAGLHTKGKHYLARSENIARYTHGRYAPDGQLNETAEALPSDERVPTASLPEVSTLRDMAFPSLSSCPAGMLVFPDDLFPEGSELKESPFCSICLLDGRDLHAQLNRAPLKKAFQAGALKDAAKRLAVHWDAQVITCTEAVEHSMAKASPGNVGAVEKMRIYAGEVDVWAEGVLTWIKNENLKSIWFLRPPVGIWATALEELMERLANKHIQIFSYRRRWDAIHWPHATHGYFRFREGLEGRIERFLHNRP